MNPAFSQPTPTPKPALRSPLGAICRQFWMSVLLVAACVAALAVPTQAGTITVTAANSGSDLTLSWTGSWDITASYPTKGSVTTSPNYSQVNTGALLFDFLSYGTTNLDTYSLTEANTADTGLFTQFFAGTASGDNFRIEALTRTGFDVLLPENYVSGTTISGVATYSSNSIATMFGTNLNSGPVTGFSSTLDGTTNSVVFQAVPEPTTLPVVTVLGMAAGAAAMRRRSARKAKDSPANVTSTTDSRLTGREREPPAAARAVRPSV